MLSSVDQGADFSAAQGTIPATSCAACDRPDRTALPATITVPTPIVVGSEDPISTPAEAEQVTGSIRGARLAAVPGCGHLVPMEDPSAFAQQLGAFWRSLG
ncbi:MAG TPA: alpha/beta fold hydrolase [Planctomycetota bacterium]|nr:alpha/beta fold hydrolase [Planctomycetota bacterium]